MSGEIRIEPLTEIAQFAACVALQNEVWGYDVTGMMTQKSFLLTAHIGGQVLGAYAGDTLVGYAMAMPGVRNGHVYLHSHHLAVLPPWRNAGVGRRLKLAQLDEALSRGIELIEWTFDPLEIKNSHLNFAKLGAIARRYKRNFYGASSSPLHGGLPTDRLFAEWWLKSERVKRVLAGEAPDLQERARVDVPSQIAEWKAQPETRAKASEVQNGIATALQDAFARGLAVIGYERKANGDGQFVLGEWSETFRY